MTRSTAGRSHSREPRPDAVFDVGLQHERTSLAWERTAFSLMAAGLVLSRFAASEALWLLAIAGMAQVVLGAVLLVWSGAHYEELHGPLRVGGDVVHPSAVRWVGRATIASTGAALVAAVFATLAR
jgi:uncharacterized membrane protein YidH (DUF202 family)